VLKFHLAQRLPDLSGVCAAHRDMWRYSFEQEDRCVEVFVNGELQQLPEGITVTRLLENMALADKRLAVEVNLEIVPRSRHTSHMLQAGDRVEIVHAIGGG
jgi:sulfur carrier protein